MQGECAKVEIIPNKLYWISDRNPPVKKGCHYFSVDSVNDN